MTKWRWTEWIDTFCPVDVLVRALVWLWPLVEFGSFLGHCSWKNVSESDWVNESVTQQEVTKNHITKASTMLVWAFGVLVWGFIPFWSSDGCFGLSFCTVLAFGVLVRARHHLMDLPLNGHQCIAEQRSPRKDSLKGIDDENLPQQTNTEILSTENLFLHRCSFPQPAYFNLELIYLHLCLISAAATCPI